MLLLLMVISICSKFDLIIHFNFCSLLVSFIHLFISIMFDVTIHLACVRFDFHLFIDSNICSF